MLKSPTAISVLMYHAIWDQANDGWADPQYAVGRERFRTDLAWLADNNIRVCSVASCATAAPSSQIQLAMTFDDGHVSNAWAAQVLARSGASADFFVNPGRVGRPGYLGWADLREMCALGMSIQSHGMDHRYLDEMTAVEVDEDLRRSKAQIEDRVGQEVSLFAPPGGRCSPGLAGASRALGYRHFCSSKPGWWQGNPGQAEVPRMAVLASTGVAQWQGWVLQRDSEFVLQRGRYELLRWAKRLLGKQRYERWRQHALGARVPAVTPGGGP